MKKSKKLYFRPGTIFYKDPTWTVILDNECSLHWVETSRKLTQCGEGKCIWFLYSIDRMNRKVETIIPYNDVSNEDLLVDFEIEQVYKK